MNKVHTLFLVFFKLQTPKYHTKHFLKFSVFTTFCNSSLTYKTCKLSHHNHSIIPLSNHHTKIILKSFELRNIYIYIYNHTDEEDENEKQNAKNENRNDDACSLPRRTLFQFFFVFYYLFCLLFLFDDDENDDKNDGSETVVF